MISRTPQLGAAGSFCRLFSTLHRMCKAQSLLSERRKRQDAGDPLITPGPNLGRPWSLLGAKTDPAPTRRLKPPLLVLLLRRALRAESGRIAAQSGQRSGCNRR